MYRKHELFRIIHFVVILSFLTSNTCYGFSSSVNTAAHSEHSSKTLRLPLGTAENEETASSNQKQTMVPFFQRFVALAGKLNMHWGNNGNGNGNGAVQLAVSNDGSAHTIQFMDHQGQPRHVLLSERVLDLLADWWQKLDGQQFSAWVGKEFRVTTLDALQENLGRMVDDRCIAEREDQEKIRNLLRRVVNSARENGQFHQLQESLDICARVQRVEQLYNDGDQTAPQELTAIAEMIVDHYGEKDRSDVTGKKKLYETRVNWTNYQRNLFILSRLDSDTFFKAIDYRGIKSREEALEIIWKYYELPGGKTMVENFLLIFNTFKKNGMQLVLKNAAFDGGGVANMYQLMVALAIALDLPVQWHILWADDPAFFDATKGMHNASQGYDVSLPDLKLHKHTNEIDARLFEPLYHDEKVAIVFDDGQIVLEPFFMETWGWKHGPSLSRYHIKLSGVTDDPDSGGVGDQVWDHVLPGINATDMCIPQRFNAGRGIQVPIFGRGAALDFFSPLIEVAADQKETNELLSELKDMLKRPYTRRTFEATTIGRMDPAKGFHFFLLAYHYMLRNFDEVPLDAMLRYFVDTASDDPGGQKELLLMRLLTEDPQQEATAYQSMRLEYQNMLRAELRENNMDADEIDSYIARAMTAIETMNTSLTKQLQNARQHNGSFGDLVAYYVVGQQCDFQTRNTAVRQADLGSIPSAIDGYNIALNVLAYLGVNLITTDPVEFTDRMRPNDQVGGETVHMPDEVVQLSPLEFIMRYAKEDSESGVLHKFIADFGTTMHTMWQEPEKYQQWVQRLRSEVIQKANVLQYITDLGASLLSTAQEKARAKGDIDILTDLVVKRIKTEDPDWQPDVQSIIDEAMQQADETAQVASNAQVLAEKKLRTLTQYMSEYNEDGWIGLNEEVWYTAITSNIDTNITWAQIEVGCSKEAWPYILSALYTTVQQRRTRTVSEWWAIDRALGMAKALLFPPRLDSIERITQAEQPFGAMNSSTSSLTDSFDDLAQENVKVITCLGSDVVANPAGYTHVFNMAPEDVRFLIVAEDAAQEEVISTYTLPRSVTTLSFENGRQSARYKRYRRHIIDNAHGIPDDEWGNTRFLGIQQLTEIDRSLSAALLGV